VTVIAVNIEIKIPIARATANPLTEPVPNQNKIAAVIREETFESRIELHAIVNPISIA
jgi:hypothetical protein